MCGGLNFFVNFLSVGACHRNWAKPSCEPVTWFHSFLFNNNFKYGIFHRNIKAEICEILRIFEEKMRGQDFENDVIYMC